MTGKAPTPGKPCAKDFRTKPYGTGDGRRLEAEDGPVCGNGVEDGIAVEMAVEMGARKRIKGGGGASEGRLRTSRSGFERPPGLHFRGDRKKMAAKKEEMRGLIVDNVEICGFLTAFRRQTGVVRKKNEEIRRNLRRNPLTIPWGFL